MTTPILTIALADLARDLHPGLSRLLAGIRTTAPYQRARVLSWLKCCRSGASEAASEEVLTALVRDLVTLRNGQLAFRSIPVRVGQAPRVMPTRDFGGAFMLGQAVLRVLRVIRSHDPDLALRLAREVCRTHERQEAEIARTIGWR